MDYSIVLWYITLTLYMLHVSVFRFMLLIVMSEDTFWDNIGNHDFSQLTYVHYSRRASRNFVFDSKTLFSFLGGVGLLSVKTPHILNFHVSKRCIGKCSDSFTYSLNFYTKYILSKLKKHWDVEQYLYNDENVVARIFSTLSFTEYLILRQMVSNWTSYTFHYNVRNEN